MLKKFYQWIAIGSVTSLLFATLVVAPVSAQSTSANGQSQTCTTFAQSLGQGTNQSNNQNASGQPALATGPGNAATPMANCWLSIGPGQKQWYKFRAGARSNKGDENNDFNNTNGIDDSDAAIVQLAMNTPGCITFEIWTLARLNAPPPVGSNASSEAKRKDKEIARGPVGVGSPQFAVMDTGEHSSSKNSSTNAEDNKNQNPSLLLWRGGSTVSETFYIAVRNVRSDSACTYRLFVAGPTVSFPSTNSSNNG
jgi:hypothetical protein